VPIFLSVTTLYSYWSVSGLAVSFYTLLLLLALIFFFKEESSDFKFQYSSLFLVLLTLTRPEGFAIFAILASFKGIRAFSSGNRTQFVKWIGIYIIIIGSYLLIKKIYYGNFLPNTFYAKVITHSGRGPEKPIYTFGENLRLVYQFVKYLTFPLLAFCLFPFLFRKGTRKDGILLSIVSFVFLYELKVGDVPNMHLFRFFVPVMPIFIIYVSEGIGYVSQTSKPFKSSIRLMTQATIILLIAFSLSRQSKWAFQYIKNTKKAQQTEMEIARWFRENTPPNVSYLTFTGGLVPFYSGNRYAIEYNGILDEFIAHHGRTPEIKNHYIFNVKMPEFIIPDPSRVEFWNDRSFKDNYQRFDYPEDYKVGESYLFKRIK
jgi:hypothetical protein